MWQNNLTILFVKIGDDVSDFYVANLFSSNCCLINPYLWKRIYFSSWEVYCIEEHSRTSLWIGRFIKAFIIIII